MECPQNQDQIQKFALSVSYLGTRYCGWQRQSGDPRQEGVLSVQGVMEAAVYAMTGESPSVVASGRTDSGVHASGQVVHLVLKKKRWTPYRLQMGLNCHLPSDIRVWSVHEVGLDFHAQRSATKKQYSYYILQAPCDLPSHHQTSWWIRKRLDVPAMDAALKALVGEHDFKAFQARGSKPGSTVRTILRTEVSICPISHPGGLSGSFECGNSGLLVHSTDQSAEGQGFAQCGTDQNGGPGGSVAELVRIQLVGTGFLKQMVRSIVGTLVQIGEGKRPGSDLETILKEQRRDQLGPTAAARGLWLERVWYSEAIDRRPAGV